VRKYFKYFLYLYVLIGFSLSKAGSYDDFFRYIRFDQAQEIEQLLIRGFDPNTPDENGVPGIMLAVQQNSIKVALLLAKQPKIKVEYQNKHGETPLMFAALNNQLELATLLIEKGADINRKGWTPLHYASTRGNTSMMRLLIDNSAYIDAESENGTTPLMLAATDGTPLSVKLLLEEGADPTLRNRSGLNALDMAIKANREKSVYFLQIFTDAWFIQNPIK